LATEEKRLQLNGKIPGRRAQASDSWDKPRKMGVRHAPVKRLFKGVSAGRDRVGQAGARPSGGGGGYGWARTKLFAGSNVSPSMRTGGGGEREERKGKKKKKKGGKSI